MTNGAEAGSSGASAHRVGSEIPRPFCGDEYPPLKGSPGAVICTKACHPGTQMHMNEETGWVWWDRVTPQLRERHIRAETEHRRPLR
jgi:hypothetical protein